MLIQKILKFVFIYMYIFSISIDLVTYLFIRLTKDNPFDKKFSNMNYF